MTRAGVIAALDADYTRTAVMKGLSNRRVLRHHVLRNGLQPTVSVIGVQIGYLLGSLVAIEKVFNYPGLGLTIVNAASRKDLPGAAGRRARSSPSSTWWRRSPPTSCWPG